MNLCIVPVRMLEANSPSGKQPGGTVCSGNHFYPLGRRFLAEHFRKVIVDDFDVPW